MPSPLAKKKLKQAVLPFKAVGSPHTPSSKERKCKTNPPATPTTPAKSEIVIDICTPDKKSSIPISNEQNGQSPTISSSCESIESKDSMKEQETADATSAPATTALSSESTPATTAEPTASSPVDTAILSASTPVTTAKPSVTTAEPSASTPVTTAEPSTSNPSSEFEPIPGASTSTPSCSSEPMPGLSTSMATSRSSTSTSAMNSSSASGSNESALGNPPKKRRRLSFQEKEERQLEKKRKREDKQKKKEEKEQLENIKRQKKEEMRQKRQAEYEAKQEEKKKEQEGKRQKAEKRRSVKEEEQRKKEEKKLKEKEEKERAAAHFTKFFLAKKGTEKEGKPTSTIFMAFQVKGDMFLAPVHRSTFDTERRKALDDALEGEQEVHYLQEIKQRPPGKWDRTSPPQPDLEIIGEEGQWEGEEAAGCTSHPPAKAKLLQFCENRRPPYWGSWRKKSVHVSARKPLKKESILDYSVDSDEEWEEEEPGESISGSDGEEEPADDGYDVDNDFLVPHGYLSEEEGGGEDDKDGEGSGEVELPPLQERLKMKEEEFEAERKTQTKRVKPRLIGCVWMENNGKENGSKAIQILSEFCAIMCVTGTVPTSHSIPPSPADNPSTTSSPDEMLTSPIAIPSSAIRKKLSSSLHRRPLPSEAIPFLIELIHGNQSSQVFLAREFSRWWQLLEGDSNPPLSDKEIIGEIKSLAKWGKTPLDAANTSSWPASCWWVDEETRKRYGKDLSAQPACWNYVLDTPSSLSCGEAVTPKKPVKLITHFARVLTPEERQRTLLSTVVTPTPASPSVPSLTRAPKTIPETSPDSSFGPAPPQTPHCIVID